MDQKSIFELIRMERIRQDDLHPDWKGNDHGLVVLAEEFGEVARALYELNEYENRDTIESDPETESRLFDDLDSEITQVAAVCVRWLENGTDI